MPTGTCIGTVATLDPVATADDRDLIDDELVQFLRGPVSGFLGTADAMGTPDATRVLGVAAIDGCRLRVLVSERAETAWRNAQPDAHVAVLMTDITSYRSLQWKGRVESVGQSRSPGDLVLMDQHRTTFEASSALVGIDPSFAWRLFPSDGRPIVIRVEQSFDQTPGPRAGRQLRSVR